MELLVQTWIEVDDNDAEEICEGQSEEVLHLTVMQAMTLAVSEALDDRYGDNFRVQYIKTTIESIDCSCKFCVIARSCNRHVQDDKKCSGDYGQFEGICN